MGATDQLTCAELYGAVPRSDFVEAARSEACKCQINADTFLRQIGQESNFRPCPTSGAGAVGIAQIIPRFHPNVNPWEPYESLTYAALLMAQYIRTYGTWAVALAAYNAGPGAVALYGGVPPFEETHTYLTIILGEGWPEPVGLGDCTPPYQEPEPPIPPIPLPDVSSPTAVIFLMGVSLLIAGAAWAWKDLHAASLGRR